MHHDPSDAGSQILIRILPKERTLRLSKAETTKQITALRDPFLSLGSGTSTCKRGDYAS